MHFHSRNDTFPCVSGHEWPDWVDVIIATILNTGDKLMAQQDQIASDVQVIGDALTALADDLTAAKGEIAPQAPNVDLTTLDALAQRARDLAASAAPAAPAPATPPTGNGLVAVDPSAPVPTETPAPAPEVPATPAPTDTPVPAAPAAAPVQTVSTSPVSGPQEPTASTNAPVTLV